jgi:hypothetical protein
MQAGGQVFVIGSGSLPRGREQFKNAISAAYPGEVLHEVQLLKI